MCPRSYFPLPFPFSFSFDRVTLRGQLNEDAVLCTESNTYAVKFVGTSNTVFLIPPTDQFGQNANNSDSKISAPKVVASVIKVAPGNMELVEVSPRLDKLKFLLSENPLRCDNLFEVEDFEGSESNGKIGLYKWSDLVERVQASDAELFAGLKALSAVEINGYWRVVDEKYMDEVLNVLLQNSVLNDWSLNSLNEDAVIGVLETDGFPRPLAEHCLQVYGSKVDEETGLSSVWKLDEKRVCLHFAKGILRGGKKKKLESFMDDWNRKIPDGMIARFDMLEGEVLTERIGVEKWVYAFSVSSLPYNPAERFQMLFHERPKWEWNDLQPYIKDLRVPGLSSEGLLLKYTRRSQPTAEAEPIFSSK